MARLKEENRDSSFYQVSSADAEAIRERSKEIVYEVSDGSQKPLTKTKREIESMTIGRARKIAKTSEVTIEAKIRGRNADYEDAHDLF
mmetsp:Transcript_38929/g.79640  ORF Transcript_38929/g.79640 Transcript_38929/m.79640 type:complete len:88 (+) Transcript_38929:1118-1381(+)